MYPIAIEEIRIINIFIIIYRKFNNGTKCAHYEYLEQWNKRQAISRNVKWILQKWGKILNLIK